MREILFRGKGTRGKHSGEWVTGDLWHHADKESVVYSNELDSKVWVSAKTVGQFTGITDKNDKEIFEGDVVRYTNKDGTHAFYEVVWSNSCGAWMLQYHGAPGFFSVAGFRLLVEVIGNIHDNPDLLSREA